MSGGKQRGRVASPGSNRAGEKNTPAEVTIQQHTIEQHTFNGPCPPPSIMAGYGDIDPGFPNRIMVMAESEQ